ncbi:hypothetical protein BTJ49_03355 [Oleiagrimonas sp. MCCC 1A03011]|nr:hypothetical protein BTJ49_03355 [Oleiagrimonas sp. MCCC 1A03011]
MIASERGGERLIFQVIPKGRRLSKSLLNVVLSRDSFVKLDAPGLVIDDHCHAVYKDSGLYFKSLWWLKQIIDISEYYREATEADIDNLGAEDSVFIEDVDSLKERAGQWVRTRIAYILDSKVLERFSPNELKEKAAAFNLDLEVRSVDEIDKLVIPNDPKMLRSTLKFLEEEYYSGPITGANYEANSKRRIG